ncbi:MAG: NERD domain-containing protein [Neisseriaceae bacterium]|nr:MAG: NERD domain-containing protein [Neisseriaceae bacterium]
MLIKSADDKTIDIEVLQGLLRHPLASADTKRKIEQEIRFMQSGAKGERDAAYEIEFHYGTSKNWAIIHDLRIEHGGRVAQIDHILISRFLEVWVCESKRFAEGIAINEHGECAAFFGGKPYGVPSPFEQNRKHLTVLKAICENGEIALPKRLGFAIKPDFRSLVLVSKNARITRPKTQVEGLDEILKVDQIKARIDKSIDVNNNPLVMAKIIGSDTLEDFAMQLKALHTPITFDWHAKFGLSKEPVSPLPATNIQLEQSFVDETAVKPTVEVEKKSKLVCINCGAPVTYSVAKFCWFNKPRFGGNVYCMDCQQKVAVAEKPPAP